MLKYITYSGYSFKEDKFFVYICDDEFEEKVYMNDDLFDINEVINVLANAYEQRNLNPAPSIAICLNRYPIFEDLNKKSNPIYLKYKDQIEKYLLLC